MSGVPGCAVTADAVLFDLDGVLVDSTPSVERVWRDFAGAHGLDADALLADLHGRRMVEILAGALPHVRGAALVAEAERLDAAEVADADRVEAVDGGLELTARLHELGVPWAVVTSGTDAVSAARISAIGLVAPPVLVTADQVSAGKPDPEPYVTAARRLGVAPTRCLVVEDAPSGVRAGNAAGATTVAVTTSHAVDRLTAAHHQVEGTRDVLVQHVDGAGAVVIHLRCSRHHPPA